MDPEENVIDIMMQTKKNESKNVRRLKLFFHLLRVTQYQPVVIRKGWWTVLLQSLSSHNVTWEYCEVGYNQL